MTYFSKFPKTVYTLDEYQTGQVVPDILRRVKFLFELSQNYTYYDEFDIRDLDTPEILADLYYNDPKLHWVILLANEIIDPRFSWPLDTYNLKKYCEGKYNNIDAPKYYQDESGNTVNGVLQLFSSGAFSDFSTADVIINNTNDGTGYILSKANSNLITVVTSNGGFISGDQIKLASNTAIAANVSTTNILGANVAITNFDYEDLLNDEKRRIRILKPEVVADIINSFESVISRWVMMLNPRSRKLVR